jgi:hypothetical protein
VDKPVDVRAALASEWVRDKLFTISATSPRARQAALGPSEIGQACQRRLAYRIAGTPIVNTPDPLKAMFGTGFHAVAADGLTRLAEVEGATARYLIEARVSYRGVAGNVDLYDRFTRRMTDYKTTALRRIQQYQRDGVPVNYAVQGHIYAQGLIAAGEDVATIAFTFVPRDAELRDVWTWVTTPDQRKADEAIDRYENIRDRTAHDGPGALDAYPTNLCPWCPNYQPNATDLTVACPGRNRT